MAGVAIVIPAAGASSRMGGRDKLLEEAGGQPLLRRQTARALATGASVLVTLPPERPDRAAVLDPLLPRVEISVLSDAAEGMAASLRAAARWAQAHEATGLLVLPADMPDLTAEDLSRCISAFDGRHILRATSCAGTPGHPVIFPSHQLSALARLSGDRGARDLLQGPRVFLLALPAEHALTDLDTPDDWAAWRARQSGG